MKAFLWENRKHQDNASYYLLLITSTENNISPRITRLPIAETHDITYQILHSYGTILGDIHIFSMTGSFTFVCTN